MTQITGSCLCGQLHYQGDITPVAVVNCHCHHCQKATGAAYATNVIVKADELTVSGEERCYEHKSDRGSDMVKHNCAVCGSPVYGTNNTRAGMLVLRAGTIDQKDAIKPTADIFCDSAMPATPMDPATKKAARMPG